MTGSLLLLSTLTLISPAQAKQPLPLPWLTNFEKAKEQARLRNVPIFLTFQAEGTKKGRLQEMGTFKNANFTRRAIEEVIFLVAHRGAEKGEPHVAEPQQDPRTGATVYVVYGAVSCEEHEALERELSGAYPHSSKPATFLLAPDGTVLVDYKGFGERGDMALKKIAEAQKKLEGPSLRLREYRKILKKLDKAESLRVDEKWSLAIANFEKIGRDRKLTAALREKVDEALADINRIGLGLLEEAKKLHADNPSEGMAALKKVRGDFKGLEASDQARAAIAELEGKDS